MVSDEENLIDFEASVGKEEEMEKEGGPNATNRALHLRRHQRRRVALFYKDRKEKSFVTFFLSSKLRADSGTRICETRRLPCVATCCSNGDDAHAAGAPAGGTVYGGSNTNGGVRWAFNE